MELLSSRFNEFDIIVITTFLNLSLIKKWIFPIPVLPVCCLCFNTCKMVLYKWSSNVFNRNIKGGKNGG